MSYYKVKSVSIKPKRNKISVLAADSSIRPLYWFHSDYGKEELDFEQKLRVFYESLMDKNMRLYNTKSNQRLILAEMKVNEMVKSLYDCTSIGYLWDNYGLYQEALEKCYPVWRGIVLNEK